MTDSSSWELEPWPAENPSKKAIFKRFVDSFTQITIFLVYVNNYFVRETLFEKKVGVGLPLRPLLSSIPARTAQISPPA